MIELNVENASADVNRNNIFNFENVILTTIVIVIFGMIFLNLYIVIRYLVS